MTESPIIFSVPSKADFGLEGYYLDNATYHHIIVGHRNLANIVIFGIKETVENPTHVYRSSYDDRRLQFLSHNVLSAGGRPMNVIIQIEQNMGRVVTASPKTKVNGTIVWDLLTGLYVSYDERSDILYFSHGDSRPSYADDAEDDPRIWLRFHEEDESPAGITVFDAADVWSKEHKKLTQRVSEFLRVEASDVETRVKKLIPAN